MRAGVEVERREEAVDVARGEVSSSSDSGWEGMVDGMRERPIPPRARIRPQRANERVWGGRPAPRGEAELAERECGARRVGTARRAVRGSKRGRERVATIVLRYGWVGLASQYSQVPCCC